MADNYLYTELSSLFSSLFDGKVQKISINAGFTCPNRNGEKGWGGCTFCNNQTFNPDYCEAEKSITEQLIEGKAFFARKYPNMKYLAYFQAYTNTYGPLSVLMEKYEEALAVPGVVGIVIGTRPDCMPAPLLDCLEQLARHTFVMVEYGVESANDTTLKRINRGHTYEQSCAAIEATARRGIITGGHIILGLPGEHHDELMRQARLIAQLPLHTLKLHQLQIIRGTRMEQDYVSHPDDFHLFTLDQYIDTAIDYIELLPQAMVVERFVSQSPKSLLIAPDWGLKNYEFAARLKSRMLERGNYQGRLYKG